MLISAADGVDYRRDRTYSAVVRRRAAALAAGTVTSKRSADADIGGNSYSVE